MRYYDKETEVVKVKNIIKDFIILLVIVTIFGCFGTISAGERGIKTRFNQIVGTIDGGLYFKMPFIEKMVKMDVQTQSMVATKEEPLSAASNDLQDTKLAVVVNYHIDPATVEDIYRQYKNTERYYSTIVDPQIVGVIKATASQYTAAEQIQKRLEMQAKMLSSLQSAFEGKNVVIEKVDITDVSFSPSFTSAIEAKVTAVQNAEAQKNKLEQIKYEAEQTVVTAKANAEAQRISSAALEAQGGKAYVELEAVKKWDGHLPNQMIPGQSLPFINLNK